MLKETLLFASVFLSQPVPAQAVHLPVGSGYTKATAYSQQFSDAFSFSVNQASLAGIKTASAGVYSEHRFLLKSLSQYSAAVVLPTNSGAFGFKADYFGQPAYNESALGLAYGRSLGDKAAVGVQFNYLATKASGYGHAGLVNFSVSGLVHLTSQLSAGMQAYNPVGAGWGKEGLERLPAIYSFGLGYDASPQVFVGAEVEKAENQPVGVNIGMHYRVAEKLVVRAGMQSATAAYYFGGGVRLNRLRVDATATLHPYLGLTPGLLLLYSSKE